MTIDRVMVAMAHPDDAEFSAGGTIAQLVKDGREVTYVVITNGNKGSADRTVSPERLARIREEEQRQAARTLGVARVEFLGYEDGEVEDTRALRLDLTRQIRRWRPDLVIAQSPRRAYANFFAWHRDHRIAGGVVLDCVYPLARDHMAFPELSDHAPHEVEEIHLIQWDGPPQVVDITATIELKLRAVACHASQVGDWTPVEARVRSRAAILGEPKGYSYAEGFERIVLGG
jgi:LmbE family N-acetylglucosaminyl deacetylase